YISFPIPDRDVPESTRETTKLCEMLAQLASKGENIVIHCRQGIGRSSIVAAIILTRQERLLKRHLTD
ncbi:MAG TPA: protein-tyrosine phosphatase family protein, partial [Blastocatellia bacterium]|nr:protein-tyrosine phosphatase family protein [Blastocatellia bacterium]